MAGKNVTGGFGCPISGKVSAKGIRFDALNPGRGAKATAQSDSCVGRWFLNVEEWNPSTEEWAFVLRRLPPAERERVMRYVFEMDRKLALGSRLLQRYCVRSVLGLRDDEYEIIRTRENKPYLRADSGSRAEAALRRLGVRTFTFNASHHGSIVALACESDCVVGLDVVKETDHPGRGYTAETYFEAFEDKFTENEWLVIRRCKTESEKFREFYRYWSMKEAYIKAHSFGLGVELLSLSCEYIQERRDEQCIKRAKVLVNGTEPNPPWSFAMMRIDPDHVATVSRAPPQHCHSTFLSNLPKRHLTTREMKECNDRVQPAFKRVFISDLIDPIDLQELNKIRHSNHYLQLLSRDSVGTEVAQLYSRWLKWLFSSSHCQALNCEPTPLVFSLSGVDTEHHELLSWVRNLPFRPNSMLVVTGDIATDPKELEETLCSLKEKFAAVFFIAGKRELGSIGTVHAGRILSLFEMLIDVLELCDRIGVRARPCRLNACDRAELTIVPLFSWPDSKPGDGLTSDKEGTEGSLELQTPCREGQIEEDMWPWHVPPGVDGTSRPLRARLASHFMSELNIEVQCQCGAPMLESIGDEINCGAGGRLRPSELERTGAEKRRSVVSFSHFNPKRSKHLQAQVDVLSPAVHVCGDLPHGHVEKRNSGGEAAAMGLCLWQVWP